MMIEARNNEFMSVADGLMLRRNHSGDAALTEAMMVPARLRSIV
jgi:hypothetical protein